MSWLLVLALFGGSPRPQAGDQPPSVRIGVIAGPLGSFASTILNARQIPFETVANGLPSAELDGYDVLVVDNLFRLQDLNGPAFKHYVEQGGVLLIINPKQDGFTQTWSPYEIFIGEYAREGRIEEEQHPIFKGFTDDKLRDFANSEGPYVGNCSFAEPAKEWRVLAKHKNGKNALIVEAGYGRGWMVLACTRFDFYNAKPGPTRLGDNLFEYVIAKATEVNAAAR